MLTLSEKVEYRSVKHHKNDSGPSKVPCCPKLYQRDVGLDDMTVQRVIPRKVMEAALEAWADCEEMNL